jgi:hypothetical protein
MQRREAKIGLRDRKRHRRPKERNDAGENTHRNGLFRVGPGIRGSVGLDGVHAGMKARVEYLAREGLARRQGQRIIFSRDLLETLRRRELDQAAARVASDSGLPYRAAAEGHVVNGVYRQRISLASGRFAMIDDGLGFSLVPWTPSLERHLGREVVGIARTCRIEWTFAKQRGLGLG